MGALLLNIVGNALEGQAQSMVLPTVGAAVVYSIIGKLWATLVGAGMTLKNISRE
jgi:hypothetical protein